MNQKHEQAISCKCKCKFDERKCNSNQKWNINILRCGCKKYHTFEKHYIWNPVTCSCKNCRYLASIINNSVIISNETVDAKQKQLQQILMTKT